MYVLGKEVYAFDMLLQWPMILVNYIMFPCTLLVSHKKKHMTKDN